MQLAVSAVPAAYVGIRIHTRVYTLVQQQISGASLL
jgi:hypothetical protein